MRSAVTRLLLALALVHLLLAPSVSVAAQVDLVPPSCSLKIGTNAEGHKYIQVTVVDGQNALELWSMPRWP